MGMFANKESNESYKITEKTNLINEKMANPVHWNSMDKFLTILGSSKRKCDQAFSNKEYSKALKHYLLRLNNRLINVHENKSFLFMQIGHVLRMMDEDEKAIVSYRNALDINSELDCAISSFSVLVDKMRANSQLQ